MVQTNDQIGLSTLAKCLDDNIERMACYFPHLKKTKQRSYFSINTAKSFYQLTNHIRSLKKRKQKKKPQFDTNLFCT